MGREHILAKKRMYLLVQGTSDFPRGNQVVMGKEPWWGWFLKAPGRQGAGVRATEEALAGKKGTVLEAPGPSECTSVNQKPGQELHSATRPG